jgi:hypothetical protein
MAAIKTYKKVGPTFTMAKEIVAAEWDFSQDGGAVGSLDVFEAGSDIVITHFHSSVQTACTSGGSATLKVGTSGDDDAFMTTTQGAVASLTAGAVVLPLAIEGTPNTLSVPVKLASGSKVVMAIGTAAMTAGKVKFVIEYIKA